MPDPANRVVCLSNVHDDNYALVRGEPVAPCLSAPKRRELFSCIRAALGAELIVVSSPPRAVVRRKPKWLRPAQTRFHEHNQFFAANLDAPKLRIPLSWIFYAIEALRHTRRGDLVVIDNYEIIYIIAAYFLKWFRRTVFVLDYEDGKHLIDRGWSRVLSRTAEWLGRPLISGAFVAHPSLSSRLPESVPWQLVPGFVLPAAVPSRGECRQSIRFLYSGSLDHPRGVDLILQALPLLPDTGWTLDITGAGWHEDRIASAVGDPRWKGRVRFHGHIAGSAATELARNCDVGLNCQRESDPISGVTFPSKIFSYLSAGLIVISSRASQVPAICGRACQYYEIDTPQALAAVMNRAIKNFDQFRGEIDRDDVAARYSPQSTAERIQKLLIGLFHHRKELPRS